MVPFLGKDGLVVNRSAGNDLLTNGTNRPRGHNLIGPIPDGGSKGMRTLMMRQGLRRDRKRPKSPKRRGRLSGFLQTNRLALSKEGGSELFCNEYYLPII